jgi:hypothetical protein
MGAFDQCRMLSEIAVDESNTNYSSYDGLLYNKAMDTLIVCPLNRRGTVHFPESVRYVRHSVFDKCVGLQEAVVDEDNVSLKSVDGILYNYAVDTLIYCPIGRLRGVKLPSSVKVIMNSAFKDCQLMDDIVLDSALTQIRGLVFSGCTSLSTMTLPCLVNFVGYGAFSGCKNLKSIVCKAVTPPDYGDLSVFDSSAVKNLCVPCASVSAYSVSDLWKEIASIQAIDDLDCGSAVVDAMVSNATVYTQGRKIIVVFDDSRRSGDAISSVSIYDIEGGLIYRSKRGDVDFDTPSSGVYVVKVGKESKKVLIQ